MSGYVLGFHEIGRGQAALVGGKGAHLAKLSRIEGLSVPPGFCVTTEAFRRVMATTPQLAEPLDRLSQLEPDDRAAIGALSAEVRSIIEGAGIPDDLAGEIVSALAGLGEETACAVRSSATAEDLPTASFAGQQDTYLNITGAEAVLQDISRCWASLFSERAVTYRLRNGWDHRKVQMAVVVQRMVVPHAAGVLFTADPVTGNRKVASVEASFGLGEALVSGLVNPDIFKLKDGEVVARTIAAKDLAIRASPAGGVAREAIAAERREEPSLTNAQAVRLAGIGRRIEAHFGAPQDIEWCLAGDGFHIVQSRPITTLFPIPATDDGKNRVYLSTGHQQMMTDPMKPLGLSLFQLTAKAGMHEAAGRLFVEVSNRLADPAGRASIMGMAGRSDPLTGDALQTIIDRGYVQLKTDSPPATAAPAGETPPPIASDPAVVAGLIERAGASNAALKVEIEGRSGPELIDFIIADIEELQRFLFDPLSIQAIYAAVETTWRINDDLRAWLGEKNPADALTQGADGNVTSEMGLELLDVADAIRPHPEVTAFLQKVAPDDDRFLETLAGLPGGGEAKAAIEAWLDRYGMRCVGEIDITRTRWIEQPAILASMIVSNIRNFEPGAAARRLEQGRETSRRKEAEVLAALSALPDGEEKVAETRRLIDRLRTFIGYREYPKYFKVSRYFIYKQALMEEARRLARAGAIDKPEDIFYLTLPELRDVARAGKADRGLIAAREEAFRSYQALTPPRVLTSEGEAVTGGYRRDDLPAGALVGLPVSAGTVEGRARVILDMAEADLEPGDILVTAYTDPSWTPLFVAIKGLVTEVGGLMSHGTVIAREYGLPAVVGLQDATRLIKDGQRIRLNGTDGYVEILS